LKDIAIEIERCWISFYYWNGSLQWSEFWLISHLLDFMYHGLIVLKVSI